MTYFSKFRSKIKKTIFVYSYIVLDKIHGIGLWLMQSENCSELFCWVLKPAMFCQLSMYCKSAMFCQYINTKSLVNSEQNWTELNWINCHLFLFFINCKFCKFFSLSKSCHISFGQIFKRFLISKFFLSSKKFMIFGQYLEKLVMYGTWLGSWHIRALTAKIT